MLKKRYLKIGTSDLISLEIVLLCASFFEKLYYAVVVFNSFNSTYFRVRRNKLIFLIHIALLFWNVVS